MLRSQILTLCTLTVLFVGCGDDSPGGGNNTTPVCTAGATHAYTACDTDGNVYFYDSCDVKEELSATCPTNSTCVEATATTASCECTGNWTGAGCDVCPPNFTGAACDTCAGHFAGASCDACAPGWFGTDCENCRFFVATDGDDTNDGLDWATPMLSLETALASAAAGVTAGAPICEVWVEAGTYYAPDSAGGSFVLPGNVHVYGGFDGAESALAERDVAANPTILSGTKAGTPTAYSRNVVQATPLSTGAILDGFTITLGGNHQSAPTCSGIICSGGGLAIEGNGTAPVVTVKNCIFDQNSAYEDGAAVYVSGTPNATFTNCTFTGNKARLRGGAVHVRSGTTATFTDCAFNNNRVGRMSAPLDQAVADVRGGALYANATAESPTTVHLENCTFDANQADFPNPTSHTTGSGGAIHIFGVGDLEITGGAFTNNRSSYDGGAISFLGISGGNLLIHGVEFSGNEAYDNDATPKLHNGGAIAPVGATVTIDGSGTLFDDNRANKGAAIHLMLSSTLAMTAGAFTNNFATDVLPADLIPEGGAVYVDAASDATFTGTRFAGNVAGRTVGADADGGAIKVFGTLTATDCKFHGNFCWGSGSSGGAIFVAPSATATLTGLEMISNHTQGNGGALTVSTGGTVTLSNSSILDGFSYYGGAISSYGGIVSVVDTIIAGNRSDGTAALGGALWADNISGVTFENSVMAGNWATGTSSWGGGLYVASGLTIVYNCTLYANDLPTRTDENATTGGGNIYVAQNAGLIMADSVMAYATGTNGLAAFAASALNIQYTISQEPVTSTGTGNIENATLDFAAVPGLATGTWEGATFRAETYDTAINAPALSWTPQALVGLYVQPDITSPRILPILGNQANFVIVPGDLSTMGGKTFRIINLKPKTGSDSAKDFIDKGGPDQLDNDLVGVTPVCVRTPANTYGCRDIGAFEYVQ